MEMKQLKYPNKSHRKFQGDDITMIVNMYSSGMSAQAIANELHAQKKTILDVLNRIGIIRKASETKTIPLPQNEIVYLYTNQKWSATKIGKEYNVDAHTILTRLRSWNIEIVKIRQPKSLHIDIEPAAKQYLSGTSASKISSEIGISESALLRRLKEHGIKIRPPNRPEWKPLPIKSIIKDYSNGLNSEQIANKHNCSLSHVLNKLHENGIETKCTGLGNVCTTLAGETVRSSLELFVANWLYTNSIEYEYEPKLKNSRFVPDFKVNGTLIEVCGVMQNIFGYEDRLNRKVQFYKDNNLDYVLLFPSDINDETLEKTFNT